MEYGDCEGAASGLAPGDVLVIYSGGISEAPDANGEAFGEPDIIGVLRRERHGSDEAMMDAMGALHEGLRRPARLSPVRAGCGPNRSLRSDFLGRSSPVPGVPPGRDDAVTAAGAFV